MTNFSSPPGPRRDKWRSPAPSSPGSTTCAACQAATPCVTRSDEPTRLVVVGAGWIGSEVAASARQLGKEVALIEAATVPLERVLGTEVGRMFRDLHAENGVELHMGVGVEAFRARPRPKRSSSPTAPPVAGDLFVVGVGVSPRTELAEAAGLTLDNGVVVDQHLATSTPGIWAAGDVANVYYPIFRARIRLEHWSAALNQGPVAAKNMLGQHVDTRRFRTSSPTSTTWHGVQRLRTALGPSGLPGRSGDSGRSSSSGSTQASRGRHERQRLGRRPSPSPPWSAPSDRSTPPDLADPTSTWPASPADPVSAPATRTA